MTDSLPDAFADAVTRFGDRTALIEGTGRRVSFSALKQMSDALAAGWAARGLGPGDRMLIAMPISAELYAALAAIWSLGAIAVLPEPAMGLKGLRHAARIGGIKGFCASGPYRWLRLLLPDLWGKPLLTPAQATPGAHPDHRVAPEDIALISFTSGSTGAPKAIPRSHAFLMAQRAAVSPLLDSMRDETDLVTFPVFVLINLAEGRSSVLPNWSMRRLHKLAPAQLKSWIERNGVTRLLLPPALCETLAKTDIPAQVSTLFTGGGPVFPDLIAKLKARASGLRIVSVYGSTEAEPIADLDAAAVTPEDLEAMRTGKGLLAGPPISMIDLQIVDQEIVVSGPHVNESYLDPARNIETKIAEGRKVWHRTGDAGYLDDHGRIWLLGRAGSAVPLADGLLYPFAIETAARLWPGVRRAALANTARGAVLAIEGDASNQDDWNRKAAAFGISHVKPVSQIPLDRRHRSKVDYNALGKVLR